MSNQIIPIEKALEKARFYEDNNLNFSALLLWEKILVSHVNEYRRFRYADTLRLCGHYSKSEQVFLSIDYAEIPHESRYYYHLYFGQLYMDMGKLERAKEQLMACLNFENCDTVPYIFIAYILKPDQDNEEAISFLKKALERKGDIDEVYYNLAVRFAIKGDMKTAMECIDKCLEIDPAYPNALNVKNDLSNYVLEQPALVK